VYTYEHAINKQKLQTFLEKVEFSILTDFPAFSFTPLKS